MAMDIFWLTREFPKQEVYSLTSQIVRSSRSVSANITEGCAKREYENVFKQHLIHALGSNSETENWLDFAYECKYLTEEDYKQFKDEINQTTLYLDTLKKAFKLLCKSCVCPATTSKYFSV